MAMSGVAITVTYYAWDTVNNAGKTGDVANHTLRVDRDGSEITPAGSPAQVDATNCPGLYRIALTGAEHTGRSFALHGKSSTAGISIVPRAWTNILPQDLVDAQDLAPTGGSPAAKSPNARLRAIRAVTMGARTSDPDAGTIAHKDEDGTTVGTHTYDEDGNRTAS